MFCDYCRVAVATHFCGRCVSIGYCSAKCQQRSWDRIHSKVCRPFQFIEGKRKGEDIEDVEALYQEKLREYANTRNSALVEQLEQLYRRLSPERRAFYASRHPCHNDDDIITGDSLDDLQPDNVMHLWFNDIKYCFSVDGIWRFVRTKYPFDPNSREEAKDMFNNPLSAEQVVQVQQAVDARIATELERIYNYERDFEASIYNLTMTYLYRNYDFGRIDPNRIANSVYVAYLFLNYEVLKEVLDRYPVYVQYVNAHKNFWRDLVRRLEPNWNREDQYEERGRYSLEHGTLTFFLQAPDEQMIQIVPQNPRNVESILSAYESSKRYEWYDYVLDQWAIFTTRTSVGGSEEDYEDFVISRNDIETFLQNPAQYNNSFTVAFFIERNPPYVIFDVTNAQKVVLRSIENVDLGDLNYYIEEYVTHNPIVKISLMAEGEGFSKTFRGNADDAIDFVNVFLTDYDRFGPWLANERLICVIAIKIY